MLLKSVRYKEIIFTDLLLLDRTNTTCLTYRYKSVNR